MITFVGMQNNALRAYPGDRILDKPNNTFSFVAMESDDEEFVAESAQGALLEVKLGELAQTNGSSQVVKDFGKMMVTDHQKGYDELQTLAAQKHITIPAGLTKKGQRKYDKLAKKTGHEFDKEYMDYMVEDHNDDIDEFTEATEESKDADIKAWVTKTLPTLRHHLEMAKAGYASVK